MMIWSPSIFSKTRCPPLFRWGQTPLTEAIQFKHTKVAAMIKRTAKAREMKKNKVGDQVRWLYRVMDDILVTVS